MDRKSRGSMDLHRYLDGEMTNEETREFEQLLEKSPELKREADLMGTVGDVLRHAMQDEVERADFRRVWPRVSAAIDETENASSTGWVSYFRHVLTPVRIAVGAAAGVLIVGVAALLMWHLAISPPSVEAAPTTVESVDYGGNPDIVISVETLEDSVTTVVTILEFETEDSIVPE